MIQQKPDFITRFTQIITKIVYILGKYYYLLWELLWYSVQNKFAYPHWTVVYHAEFSNFWRGKNLIFTVINSNDKSFVSPSSFCL